MKEEIHEKKRYGGWMTINNRRKYGFKDVDLFKGV